MFMAEKGIDLPRIEVDLRGGENRQDAYLKVNPAGQTPALEMDGGGLLSEITAICEYLEEKHPSPPLIGTTPEERAETRMWTRRVDLNICEPMTNGFRYGEGLAMFQSRIRCLPEASPGLKAVAQDGLRWLEANMKGPWIAGDRFTLADIQLFAFMDFGAMVGQPVDTNNKRVADWFERVKARPSAAASA
ncbi:MAG: glutathione S-transferase family protein [Phenylobacterium sp.]|nr:glutathione S-transferase family protein [Phenylobacterium sp.]